MNMGNSYSEEKKKEWININRVSREEQYGWFKTLRYAEDEDIIHIIKTSPQMITTVMHFDTYNVNGKNCDCHFELEQCVKFPGGNERPLQRLDKSVAFGACPHIVLLEYKKTVVGETTSFNVLEASDDDLGGIYDVVDKNWVETTPTPNSTSFGNGFYWIHLAVVFKRRKLIQDILPVIKEYLFPSFVWYTVQNWISPLYLAVLSGDHEMSSLLCKYNPKFLEDKLRIKFPNENNQISSVPMIQRIASLDNLEALKTLMNISNLRNKKILQNALKWAFKTRALTCIKYLLERGITLDTSSLKTELNTAAVFQNDIKMVNLLLKSHKVSVSPHLLMLVVKKGDKDMVQCLLDNLPKDLRRSLGIKSEDFKDFSSCLVEAVLNNSLPLVKLLLEKNLDVNVCFKNLSALKWAQTFKYTDIEQVLKDAGALSFYENSLISRCVFNSVLTINQRNDHMIKRLLEIAQDVNDGSDGTPPFYTTMRLRRYDTMQELLLSGADPYLQPETWKYFLIRQEAVENWRVLLHVFVRVNVSLSCDVKLTLIQYLCQNRASHFFRNNDLLRLILLSAHTLTEKDISILKETRDMFNCDVLKAEINEHVYKPKSLSVMCRNSIRRKFGQNLHKFLDIMKPNLPTKFLNFLNCNDVLEKFYTEYERQKFTKTDSPADTNYFH